MNFTTGIVRKTIFVPTVLGVGVLLSVFFFVAAQVPYSTAAAQNQQQMITDENGNDNNTMSMMERGDIAMGFNQNKITHNFRSTPTGGEIILSALDNNDTETIKQIINHTLNIQREFSEGFFTKPFFIHAQEVPGTKVMSEKKSLIKYSILDMKNGSTLMLATSDKQLIDAIRQFMDFQATAHLGY